MRAGRFELAVEHHRAGRWTEAERLYREVLTEDETRADALFLLGAIALQAGRADEALTLFERAIRIDPDNGCYHANLGECYRLLRRPADAMDAYLKALMLRPDLAEPMFNLGLMMQEHGEVDLAISCYECASELRPGAEVIRSRLARARDARREQRRDARRGRATARSGLSAQLLAGVAATLGAQGRPDSAIELCRRALELDPRCANAHHNLGAELLERSQIDEAIASFERALRIDPKLASAHGNLGNAHSRCGRLDEAIASYRRALALERSPEIHSNIVFTLPFHPDYEERAILREAANHAQYGDPLSSRIVAHPNDPTPDRRLRVGYLSPDFRLHCQTLFTTPLLARHDHDRFEIFLYADVDRPDRHTERLRGYADRWRSTVGASHSDVAQRIRDDRIDILVDLTMHMAKNRLLAFAEKPAPVQVCWLAYPGTTGLTAMDYRITDPYLDPPGRDESVYSECSVRLPETFWCYDPLAKDLPVGPLPARRNGRITFGCLNNFAKVNAGVLELWARVLGAVNGARLLVMAPEGESRQRARQTLGRQGVDASRIEFVDRKPRSQYLASYGEIDVCLDTFPSNGHTTSLDALWMGVPVVTLVGDTIVGRAGLCQAKNLALDELIAWTREQYVQISVDLGRNLEHLSELRAGLRARLESSPLMDGHRFARNMEAAYRTMWRDWCARRAAPSS